MTGASCNPAISFYRLILATLSGCIAVLLITACSPGSGVAGKGAGDRPNILFILVDDLGYNDLGINGGRVGQTPNLNQFAAEGVRFTGNYVDSTCSATRAGILTGTSPAARGYRPHGIGISPEIITLPEALREQGYSTHHVGKWHLGYLSKLAWPTAQGFDSFFGFLSQFLLRGPHTEGKLKVARPTYIDPWLQEGSEAPVRSRGHLSDILLQRVLGFLDTAADREEPWFLNYWTYAPHAPIEPAQRFASQFENTPQGRYRALVAQMDNGIGQVLESLRRNQLLDSTLVMIASDNGGTNRELDNNAPYGGAKATFLEGGVRTPLLIRWPDGIGGGELISGVVSYLDYYPTLVQAAGGAVPGHLPGRDLRPLIEGEPIPRTALFWETGDSQTSSWAALSPDGRWRLSRYFVGGSVLHDIGHDPGAEHDLALQLPAIASNLHDSFISWRHQQRRVQVSYDSLGVGGRAVLRGESLQRSPGFGGFSFAIGLKPGHSGEPEADVDQVIAFQTDGWGLIQRNQRLELDLHGIALSTAVPPANVCSSVVVSAQYIRSDLYPEKSRAVVELFINGQLADKAEVEPPPPVVDNFLQPTFIGQDASGNRRYLGELGVPVILNERLRADDESDPGVRNGVGVTARAQCPG